MLKCSLWMPPQRLLKSNVVPPEGLHCHTGKQSSGKTWLTRAEVAAVAKVLAQNCDAALRSAYDDLMMHPLCFSTNTDTSKCIHIAKLPLFV